MISRRKNQRRKKRLFSMLKLTNSQATKCFLSHKIIQLQNNFGFIADPNKKLQYNFREAIRQLDTSTTMNTNSYQSYTAKTNLFHYNPRTSTCTIYARKYNPHRYKKPPWSKIKKPLLYPPPTLKILLIGLQN
jgi:hypothetical protein